MLRAGLAKLSLTMGVALLLFAAPAAAIGVDPVISHVKTGESSSASNEFIAIYNNSGEIVDVTDWCIVYSSASDATKTNLACLSSEDTNTQIVLEPFSYARFASSVFSASVTGFLADEQFSAGLSGTGGHIRLLDANKVERDKVGWGTATAAESAPVAVHSSGSMLVRKAIPATSFLQDLNNNASDFISEIVSIIPTSGLSEVVLPDDVCTNLDGLQTELPDDYFFDGQSICVQDQCDNLDGLQADVPAGYESTDGMNCEEVTTLPLESSILLITELLPNVTSSDTGKEFIEIYNPNEHEVPLNGYKLELGPQFSKHHLFSDGILNPFSYLTLSDLLSGLTLPNTSASLRLVAPSGDIVSQADAYDNPKDDQAWVLIDDEWQYSSMPTPGSENLLPVVAVTNLDDEELEPCPAGKYRNPETNRCRNIEVENDLRSCEPGQIRNPETNRCRSVSSADNLVPCKPGQERNPETNRCRSIVDTASALQPCEPGEERNPETNRCRKITALGASTMSDVQDIPAPTSSSFNWWLVGGAVVAALGYALYEWRSEISRLFNRLPGKK